MEDQNFTILFNASNISNFGGRVACQANWDQMAITVFISFTVIFCLSVVGNGLVIVTVVQQRWMRTVNQTPTPSTVAEHADQAAQEVCLPPTTLYTQVTNLYLLNLAISDLLLSIVCMWPTFLSTFLLKCFIFGNVMCKVLAYLQPVSVTASAYTLTVIAIERYFAICRPLHSRHWQTRSHALRMILLIWVISFLSNLLHLFAFELQTTNIPGQMNCRVAWSEENNLIHLGLLTVVLYVLPLFIMCMLYGIMIRTLWRGMRLDRGQQMTVASVSNGEIGSQDDIDSESVVEKQSRFTNRFTRSVRSAIQARQKFAVRKKCPSVSSDTKADYLDSPNMARLLSTESKTAAPARIGGDFALRSTHMAQTLQAKQRVIRMLIAVVIVFAVCWTPLYVYHLTLSIIITYYPKTGLYRLVFDWNIFVIFLTMAYSSSCTNPLLYGFLNRKFRQAFLLAFGCPSARTAVAVDMQSRLFNSAAPVTKHSNGYKTPPVHNPINESLSPVKVYRGGQSYLSEPENLRKHLLVEREARWAEDNAIVEIDEKSSPRTPKSPQKAPPSSLKLPQKNMLSSPNSPQKGVPSSPKSPQKGLPSSTIENNNILLNRTQSPAIDIQFPKKETEV